MVAGVVLAAVGQEIHRRVERARRRARALAPCPAAAPVVLNRDTIAQAYIAGTGIEIGTLHVPLGLPESAEVKYVDVAPTEELLKGPLSKDFAEMDRSELAEVDIVDDAEALAGTSDASRDFVIANHLLGHCKNPIGAVGSMFRILKEGGILYLAIPDKTYALGQPRRTTSMEHLLRDYHEGPEWSKRQHLEELARLVGKVEEEAEVERSMEQYARNDSNIRFHAWTQTEILELVVTLRRKLELEFELELFFKYGVEVILVLRKGA